MPDVSSSLPAEAPKRIQRRRTRGWRMPEGAIYVGRPTRWGNPFRWTDYDAVLVGFEGEPDHVPPASRRKWAVTDFKAAVKYGVGELAGYPSRDEIRRELAGRDLACWCPPNQACHADVLLAIANEVPAQDEATEEGFLRVPLVDGGEWVSLSRLTDGRVACCVCFKFCHRHELGPVAGEPGQVWDVCRECAQSEGVAGA